MFRVGSRKRRFHRPEGRIPMTKTLILSALLATAATFSAPAMARTHHTHHHHVAQDIYGYNGGYQPYAGEHYAYGQGCSPAPRVGAFAGEPWVNGDTVPCQPGAAHY